MGRYHTLIIQHVVMIIFMYYYMHLKYDVFKVSIETMINDFFVAFDIVEQTKTSAQFRNNMHVLLSLICELLLKLELVYLPKGKYCVYPRMVYRLAIVIPPPPTSFWMTKN